MAVQSGGQRGETYRREGRSGGFLLPWRPADPWSSSSLSKIEIGEHAGLDHAGDTRTNVERGRRFKSRGCSFTKRASRNQVSEEYCSPGREMPDDDVEVGPCDQGV